MTALAVLESFGPGVAVMQEGWPTSPLVLEVGSTQEPPSPQALGWEPLPQTEFRAAPPLQRGGAIIVGSLLDDRLRLLQPIEIRLTREDGVSIATADDIDEFGYGLHPLDAVDDLRQTIAELYWSLKSEAGQNRLGADLSKVWEVLRARIREA